MRSYQSPPLYSGVIDELSVEIEDEIDENNNDLSLNSVQSGISEQKIQEIMSLTNALNDTENNSYQPNISIIDSYSISQEDFENIVVDKPNNEKTITSEFELVSKDSFQGEKVEKRTEISDTNQLETFKCGICNAEKCSCQNTKSEPFDCNDCSQSFVSNSSLNEHITEVHVKVDSFWCENCGTDDWFECMCDD